MKVQRLVCVLFVGIMCGCGSSGEARVPTVPVKGKLYVDDKPFGPALMTLSVNPSDAQIPVVNGYVKADGSYELRTYKDGDGAPVGKYDVRLTMDPMSPGTVPSVKPMTIEVTKSGGVMQLDIKLTSTAPGEMASPLPMPGQERGAGAGGANSAFPGSTN